MRLFLVRKSGDNLKIATKHMIDRRTQEHHMIKGEVRIQLQKCIKRQAEERRAINSEQELEQAASKEERNTTDLGESDLGINGK